MAFSLSPGVTTNEVDLTTVVPAVATSIGGFAGNFKWGPLNEIVNISDETQLVSRFGKPDANNFVNFFSAANFLAYSNFLKVVRSDGANSRNAANSASHNVLIRNSAHYEQQWANGAVQNSNIAGPLVARYPGSIGNSIEYSICDYGSNSGNTYFSAWAYKSYFPQAPQTSLYSSSRGGANDEMHIIVLDKTGQISGTVNTVLEKFDFVSKASDAKKEDGSSNYWKDVINSKSKYLYWINSEIRSNSTTGNSTTKFTTFGAPNTIRLVGGQDPEVANGNLITSYGLFDSVDEIDVGLIFTADHDKTVVNECIRIAESRKDCMVFCSPKRTDVVDNYGQEVATAQNTRSEITSSSYAVMDSGWKYQYDKYNDVYRYIPLNADIAGLCARTDRERDPWFSPGGLNRGFIKNIVKLAFNPSKTDRDSLYSYQINPVVTFSGQGTVLFGDKTLTTRPSAFDRINVRRLFITLEKSISRAAKYSLFEFNDSFTRAQFVNLVEPYLRDIQGRRGITDFRVVCDETNNTGEVIDRNEFVGDIYIKPTRSINFIQLNFVATRTGIDFQEVVGRF